MCKDRAMKVRCTVDPSDTICVKADPEAPRIEIAYENDGGGDAGLLFLDAGTARKLASHIMNLVDIIEESI